VTFLAVRVRREERHPAASEIWPQLCQANVHMVVNNSVLGEAGAVVKHWLGLLAVNAFQRAAAPVLPIDWMDAVGHSARIAALRRALPGG